MFPTFRRNFFEPTEGYDPEFARSAFSNELDFNAPQAPAVSQPPPSFIDAYKELLNRQNGPAMGEYQKYLASGFPKEEDFKPTKMSRLSAILSGATAGFANPGSGEAAAHSVLQRPYEQAVRKYQFQGQRLREAANLEETQNKNQLAAVSRMVDDERQGKEAEVRAKTAEVLNRSRELGMKKTAAELQLLGWKTNVDPTTGELIGTNILNGQKQNFGKVGMGVTDRVNEASLKDKNLTNENIRQVKALFPWQEGIRFSNDKKLQEDRQEHDITMERERQSGREKLNDSRIKAAADRIAARGKSSPNINQQVKANLVKVQSLVDRDEKYKEHWNLDSTDPLGPAPPVGSPNYKDWKELYDALYAGIDQLAPPKPIGKYGVRR